MPASHTAGSKLVVSVPATRDENEVEHRHRKEKAGKKSRRGDKFGMNRIRKGEGATSVGVSEASSTDKIVVSECPVPSSPLEKSEGGHVSMKGVAAAVTFSYMNRTNNLKVKSLDPGNLSASDSSSSSSLSTKSSSSSSSASSRGKADSLSSSSSSTTLSSDSSSSSSTCSSEEDTGVENDRYWSRFIPPCNTHYGPVSDDQFTTLSSFLHKVVSLAHSPLYVPPRPQSSGSPWVPAAADPFRNHPAYYLSEPAIVYEWNSQFSSWTPRQTRLIVSQNPFAEGAMRASYYAVDLAAPQALFVAKRYRKKKVRSSQYFNDASMHWVSNHWADMFNGYSPPKAVQFVPAAVAELVSRGEKDGRTFVLGLEPYLTGKFRKYNNNNGFVATSGSNIQRSTPQAFSHFTYHYSCGELMVVDIQGVGDAYTDPQLLTTDGEGYGRGNLGTEGMKKFFKTHKCNAVCTFLRLPNMGRILKRALSFNAAHSKHMKGQLTGSTVEDEGISEDLSAFLRSSTSSHSNTTSDDSSGSSSTSSTSSSYSSSSSTSDATVSPRKVRPHRSASKESSSTSSSSVSPASPTKRTKQQLPVVQVDHLGVSDSPRPKAHDRSDKRHHPPTSTHEHIHRLAVASRFWNLFKDGAQTDPESPMRKSHPEFPNAACGRSPSVSVREDPSAHLPQTLMRINPMLNSSVDSLQGLLAAGDKSK